MTNHNRSGRSTQGAFRDAAAGLDLLERRGGGGRAVIPFGRLLGEAVDLRGIRRRPVENGGVYFFQMQTQKEGEIMV